MKKIVRRYLVQYLHFVDKCKVLLKHTEPRAGYHVGYMLAMMDITFHLIHYFPVSIFYHKVVIAYIFLYRDLPYRASFYKGYKEGLTDSIDVVLN